MNPLKLLYVEQVYARFYCKQYKVFYIIRRILCQRNTVTGHYI